MNKVLVIGLGSIGVRHVNNLLENFKDIRIIICTKRKHIPKEIENNNKIIISRTINEGINHKLVNNSFY